jgi:predicted XRE-type DNA-binding protein
MATYLNNDDVCVTESCGNIFIDLGFPPHEAELLQVRADLMARLKLWITESRLTQAEAAEKLGITQTRVSNLVRGHWKKFSLDMLLALAAKAGLRFKLNNKSPL